MIRKEAETEGFEPSIRYPVYTLSRRASSTTRAGLRLRAAKILFHPSDSENFFCIFSCNPGYFFYWHFFHYR